MDYQKLLEYAIVNSNMESMNKLAENKDLPFDVAMFIVAFLQDMEGKKKVENVQYILKILCTLLFYNNDENVKKCINGLAPGTTSNIMKIINNYVTMSGKEKNEYCQNHINEINKATGTPWNFFENEKELSREVLLTALPSIYENFILHISEGLNDKKKYTEYLKEYNEMWKFFPKTKQYIGLKFFTKNDEQDKKFLKDLYNQTRQEKDTQDNSGR